MTIDANGLVVKNENDVVQWSAQLVAQETRSVHHEIVEWSRHYAWVRVLSVGDEWARLVEVQADAVGTVTVQAHVQRQQKGDGFAPDLGWEIRGLPWPETVSHAFATGEPYEVHSSDGGAIVAFPRAAQERRGRVSVEGQVLRFMRCEAGERVPMQQTAWRSAGFIIGPTAVSKRTPLFEPEQDIRIAPEAYQPAYGVTLPPDLSAWPTLDDLRRATNAAIAECMVEGDDFGNVTAFNEGAPAPAFGMNRLHPGTPLFEEAWRTGDRRLRETAVLWCGNMHDLSVWWGDDEDFGGTRYNNALAQGDKTHEADTTFMWRTNWASSFCTKGFDAFFLAYEETGDPRFLAALRAQTTYAKTRLHALPQTTRNIGDVRDFLNLARWTGCEEYRLEALRLFSELRTTLSTGDLFTESGLPIVVDGPFINDDQVGTKFPYAKPYIIGYALAGLPELLRLYPEEPRLHDTVRAVAEFVATTVDPSGGWRYPHPASARVLVAQGLEHAVQLCRAADALELRGEPVEKLLDAVEQVLQARLLGFRRSGTFLAGLGNWEARPGALPEGQTVYDLYAKPADRDASRDYTEGEVSVGGAPPEGLVYFGEVLAFYLRRRPAERLFAANPKLASVLERVPDRRIKLTPLPKGAYVRMERPENARVGFTLWGPEWVTCPNLGYGEEELGGMALDWKRDPETGALWYAIERDTATFTAGFIPHVDYVECFYTVWPKPGYEHPPQLGVGPCQQMKDGLFESDDSDLLARLWYLSDGRWTTVASVADGNARNVLFIKGQPSPDMTGAMAESGWKTLQTSRPDHALIACTSTDGEWVAAAASEYSSSICNNANASHRCIHSQGSLPLNSDGPTTLRVNVYLMKGSLDDLRHRYDRDAARWKAAPPTAPMTVSQRDTYGMLAHLPSFSTARVRRMDYPLAWRNTSLPFGAWREMARKAYLESLQTPPPRAPFNATTIASEDRGSYEARKLALNISVDSRIEAYLLVPKGEGPFPAMLALHDHGAHFSIGKEKVVMPFDVTAERRADAQAWVDKYYGGRWIGDELASRGYVVLAIDALFWGDRGRQEGVEYTEQQALAANMLQLGMAWAGHVVWDDLRSAEFLQSLPEVNPDRIGCLGLSMGAHRTWNLAAATDIVKAGAAICWMGDTPTLMAEGNNQTVGQSSFSMIFPGLRNALDYPDVASIACPKPMLFFNGTEDHLFPVAGVEASYDVMRQAWQSQGAGDRLVTKLWPVPHLFNLAMQEEAFAWLDSILK